MSLRKSFLGASFFLFLCLTQTSLLYAQPTNGKIEDFQIVLNEVNSEQVVLQMSGYMANSCVFIASIEHNWDFEKRLISVKVKFSTMRSLMCAAVIGEINQSVILDRRNFFPGQLTIDVNGIKKHIQVNDDRTISLEHK